jgi:hypothetical protein
MLINDYLFFDDALEDPDAYVELAKSLAYYNAETQEISGLKFKLNDVNRPLGQWRGHRSDSFHSINNELFKITFNKLFLKILNLRCRYHYDYEINSYFNYSPEFVPQGNNKNFWWHEDPGSVFAGVIYLTKNNQKDSGTLLRIGSEEVKIENVFNRLVMYDSKITHRPEGCFGTTVDDARLTLTFFVNKLIVQMKNDT